MVVDVPYRPISLPSPNGLPETHWVRVTDAAVAEWLRERARLKHRGYPDRPPDVDTATLRAWLPRLGEGTLPYFRGRLAPSAGTGDTLLFPVLDFAGLMDRASREHWALIALDLNVDTSTPAGEAMAAVLATFAQFERRLIGERTKAALAVKRAQGVRLGRPRLIPDDIVARIVAERSSRATLRAIADGLNRDGVPTAMGGRQWWVATVQGVLSQAGSSASPVASGGEVRA